MTETPAPAVPDERRAMERAAEWFVLLASGEASEADRASWQAWRGEHPSNEQAWQRAERSAARFADIPREQAAASLRALDLAHAPPSRSRRKGLVQLAVLLAAGAGGWQLYRASGRPADLITAIGEQREATLADGSRLVLDTGTAVDIGFSSDRRLVRLRSGRIMIATALDPARPFVVETGDGRVRALGTRFTVQQEPGSTLVSVLEARVALYGKQAPGEAPILSAGQAGRFDRSGLIERRAAPATDAAWLRGMLVADDMRLADVVAQLARYRRGQLACDAAAGQLRISGTFPLRDTERALAAIGSTLPVRLDRSIQVDGVATVLISRR
jgi:transmembrane sensor